jgi:hypothetical protein
MPSDRTAETTIPPDGEKLQKLRPTLFVGLGGTGKEILLRLRRRILQEDWRGNRVNRLSEFPVAAFIYFDLDKAPAVASDSNAVDDPLADIIAFDGSETMQDSIDAEAIIRNLGSHTHIASWWPGGDMKTIDVTKGAGQIRALSRMAFFIHAATFKNQVFARTRQLMQNVTNAEALNRLGLDVQNELRIIVVASTAGGTGSGCFIDAGLMLRSQQSPKPQDVNLYLVLPGGFVGNNADRVQANTYAALMELEHTMRPGSTPPFVEAWTETDAPIDNKPYDDVYLLDTSNLAEQMTGEVKDVYSMVADLLFEDFGSSDFADRKRSVAVNQRQWKLGMYYPDLPAAAGGNVLGFSRGYSTVGQATLDTFGQVNLSINVSRAMQAMIDSFFGIGQVAQGQSASNNVPTTAERDDFLRDYLSLGASTFATFPADDPQPGIAEYAIINQLLVRADGSQIDNALEARVDAGVNQIKESFPEAKDWAGGLDKLRNDIRPDVQGSVDLRGGSAIVQEIEKRRRDIMAGWRSENGLSVAFYNRIDNTERGGLDYTILLIQLLRTQIGNENQNISRDLKDAAEKYRGLADLMLKRFDIQLNNLRAASKAKFLFGVNRGLCETYVGNAGQDLQRYMVYSARMRACEQAQELLADLSAYLGEVRPLQEAGQETGTGLVQEFLRGRTDVRATRAAIDFEIKSARDSTAHKSGMYFVVRDQAATEISFDATQVRGWAKEAFEGYEGSRRLFPELRRSGGQLAVINSLRASAKRHLQDVAQRVPSLLDVLGAMTSGQRHAQFQLLMNRAMPWLNANFLSMKQQFNKDQFKIYVAMRDVATFADRYRSDLISCLPPMVAANEINFVEAAVAGRMVVLCELSGIPLDPILPLRITWRPSYNKISRSPASLPLHSHYDTARFPHPIVPDTAELNELRERLGLLLRAIVFRFVRRGSDLRHGGGDWDQYILEISPGDFNKVGSERVLRGSPFRPLHRDELTKRLAAFEQRLEPIQLLAAAALFRYTGFRAYAKREVTIRGGQTEHKGGLMHAVAASLEATFRKRYDAAGGDPDVTDASALVQRMFDGIAGWTEEVADSLDDVDALEVNTDRTDRLNCAQPKRAIIELEWEPRALRARFLRRPDPVVEPPPQPQPAPQPPPPGASFHVAAADRTAAVKTWAELTAMAANGSLTATTMVWNASLGATWRPAGEVPELTQLLGAAPPPVPPAMPPPLP